MIVNCPCKHPYQDALYGEGHKVGNLQTGCASVFQVYTCTACGHDVHTQIKHGRSTKTGSGNKSKYWYESGAHVTARFNKTRSVGARV